MPTSPAKYLSFLMIGANLLGGALGTGVHLHLLLTHLHEGDPAHEHIAVVHSHAGIPDSRDEEKRQHSPGEHRHAIAVIQIVALRAALSQHDLGASEQLDECLLLHTVLPRTPDVSIRATVSGSSPPSGQLLADDIVGRSPPLL